jgi:hypothetical protein
VVTEDVREEGYEDPDEHEEEEEPERRPQQLCQPDICDQH